MSLFGLFALILWAILPVRAVPVSGAPYSADLVGMTSSTVKLRVDGRQTEVPFDQIAKLERDIPHDETNPIAAAGLANGSRLKIEGVSLQHDVVTLRLRKQPPLELPVQQLAWVRFRAPSPETNDSWLGLVDQPQASDTIVIRRAGNVLDQASGIVKSIDETRVEFELSGDTIPAPINRLEGIIFSGVKAAENRGMSVVDVFGSIWSVAAIDAGTSADSITLRLPDGSIRQLPFEQLQEIRFADDAFPLADTTPVERVYKPLVTSTVDPELLNAWLGIRNTENSDLVMRAFSRITYRIEDGYKTLAAGIIPDASVAAGTGATVQIMLDDKVAWEQMVLPGDPLRGVEIPLEQAARVSFVVDFGKDAARGDAGDIIHLIRPRLVQ